MFLRCSMLVAALLLATTPLAARTDVQEAGPVTTDRFFHLALSAGLGYGFPLSQFYENADSGLLWGVDFRVATSDRNYLHFCYRDQDILGGQGVLMNWDIGEPVAVDLDGHAREYLLLVGFLAPPDPTRPIRNYVEIGAGIVDNRVTAEGGGVSQKQAEGRFYLAAQVGTMLPLGEADRFALDINAHILAKLLGGEEGEGAGFIFGLQAGVMYRFGE